MWRNVAMYKTVTPVLGVGVEQIYFRDLLFATIVCV